MCVCSRSPLTAVRQTAPAACRYDLDLERNAADAIALAMTSSVQPLSSQTRGENYPWYNPKPLIAYCSTEKGTMQNAGPVSFENVTSAASELGGGSFRDSPQKPQNNSVETNSTPDILWMSSTYRNILYIILLLPRENQESNEAVSGFEFRAKVVPARQRALSGILS